MHPKDPVRLTLDPGPSDLDLTLLAGRLDAAVTEAAALALGYFGKDPKNWLKGGHSPVSEADMAVDAYLAETLKAASPDIGWLSEESADDGSRLKHRAVWIADPIDGTRAFLAGREDWCVAASLVIDGRPVLSSVVAPATGEHFRAVAGRGAEAKGAALPPLPPRPLEGARVAAPPALLARAAELMPITPLPRIHSLILRFARVAAGSVDAAIASGNARDWDLAAADLLVQETGAVLIGFDGAAPRYNRADLRHGALIAAPRQLADALRTRLDADHKAAETSKPR